MTEPRDHSNIDPALWRGLTQSRVSRRDLFRYAGVGAGTLSLASILAACGTKGVTTAESGGKLPNAGMGTSQWWSQQKLHKQLNFANWPYYMDVSHGTHPSLDQFTRETGIKVNYTEPIQDNPSFFAKIRPELQAGKPTGYDIVVLTNNDYPLGEMIQFGWMIPIDHSMMPNFDKYASKLVTDPSWDPGNKYSMAWQSGYTIMAYNTKYIKEDITSVQALWDPKYKGKIGMFANASELGNFGLLAVGVEDPSTSTPSDWDKAAAKLNEQKPIVRSYYDQSYIHALKNEDIWISMVWSGDIFQAALQGYNDLQVVVPDEGAMFWTDNMVIPIYAENPLDAMTYMDSVFDPKVQAQIENYNHYVCPVPASQPIMASQYDPKVAASPLVFPDAQMEAATKSYYAWKDTKDLDQWNSIFVPIFQG